MKLLTFNINGKVTYGAVRDGGIVDIRARLGGRYPDIKAVPTADALPELSTLTESVTADYATVDLEFLPVIGNPAKIFCIGLNYESHRESKPGATGLPTRWCLHALPIPRSVTGSRLVCHEYPGAWTMKANSPW